MHLEHFVPDRWLFGDDPLKITSVGVLVHTGELIREGCPSLLLLEQVDQPNKPWGIPAGHVEVDEIDPKLAAVREVKEETGMEISPNRLKEWLFGLSSTKGTAQIVYSYLVEEEWGQIGKWSWAHGLRMVEPKNRKMLSTEIGTIVLVPAKEMFDRGHPLIKQYYRWDHMHEIKAKLEGLRII
ncbi:NUDIX hydrolase [Candidatus Collierbacteria bacterium]|nr:NUDIX hydrolase [Candidatus Collierbacteria bacterium]